jgi:hypothetical protein
MALPASISRPDHTELIAQARELGAEHFLEFRLWELTQVAAEAGPDRDQLATMLVAHGVRLCRKDASAQRGLATYLFKRAFLLDADAIGREM